MTPGSYRCVYGPGSRSHFHLRASAARRRHVHRPHRPPREEWLALGQSLIRVVAPVETDPVGPMLREQGYGATVINGDGLLGEVRVTFCVVPRKKVWEVTHLIHDATPEAFVTVDQTSTVDLAARHGSDVHR